MRRKKRGHTIYLMVHRPSGKFYIGSTWNVGRRKSQWKQRHNTLVRCSTWVEWTFHRLITLSGNNARTRRFALERQAIRRAARELGADRVLNSHY